MTKHPNKSNSLATNTSLKHRLRWVVMSLTSLFAVFIVYGSYMYAMTPAAIRKPQLAHYHFRLQILVNGKAENFADQKYQTAYKKGICNGELPEQPIHFHDGKDQMVHIHWKGITGGMFLKYYGWNYIDGPNRTLGYRLDDLAHIKAVPIYGNTLPPVPRDTKFWVYTGDQQSYWQRSFNDFKTQDLETFFKPLPRSSSMSTKLLGLLFPKVFAHGDDKDEPVFNSAVRQPAAPDTPADTEKQLIDLHHLIGNAVIFVQPHKPSDLQVKDRFNKLEPLSESVCGG